MPLEPEQEIRNHGIAFTCKQTDPSSLCWLINIFFHHNEKGRSRTGNRPLF